MFKNLGFALTANCSLDRKAIEDAEARLGVKFPAALRDYYLIAGGETSFNHRHDHLLAPEKCFVDQENLVFMEENQAVVLWGVPATSRRLDNPPVNQGTNDEVVHWYPISESCITFLHVMLCWQGAFAGAMRNCAVAKVVEAFEQSLSRSWQFVGEVNEMRAYVCTGKALCFLKWDADWRVFAGAATAEGLVEIEQDCGLTWEKPY